VGRESGIPGGQVWVARQPRWGPGPATPADALARWYGWQRSGSINVSAADWRSLERLTAFSCFKDRTGFSSCKDLAAQGGQATRQRRVGRVFATPQAWWVSKTRPTLQPMALAACPHLAIKCAASDLTGVFLKSRTVPSRFSD